MPINTKRLLSAEKKKIKKKGKKKKERKLNKPSFKDLTILSALLLRLLRATLNLISPLAFQVLDFSFLPLLRLQKPSLWASPGISLPLVQCLPTTWSPLQQEVSPAVMKADSKQGPRLFFCRNAHTSQIPTCFLLLAIINSPGSCKQN